MEDRLVELETKVTFQEDLLAKLDDALIAHERDIEQLKVQLTAFREQLAEIMGQVPGPTEGRPPHY